MTLHACASACITPPCTTSKCARAALCSTPSIAFDLACTRASWATATPVPATTTANRLVAPSMACGPPASPTGAVPGATFETDAPRSCDSTSSPSDNPGACCSTTPTPSASSSTTHACASARSPSSTSSIASTSSIVAPGRSCASTPFPSQPIHRERRRRGPDHHCEHETEHDHQPGLPTPGQPTHRALRRGRRSAPRVPLRARACPRKSLRRTAPPLLSSRRSPTDRAVA